MDALLEIIDTACQTLVRTGHNTERFDPYNYPIKRLFMLADRVAMKERSEIVTNMTLTKLAIASVLTKEANTAFNKTMKEISDGE